MSYSIDCKQRNTLPLQVNSLEIRERRFESGLSDLMAEKVRDAMKA